MDTVLSGKTSQGRDVAYLVVINNWRGDQRDYKEKTRRPGGEIPENKEVKRGKTTRSSSMCQNRHAGQQENTACLRKHKLPANKLHSVRSCVQQQFVS